MDSFSPFLRFEKADISLGLRDIYQDVIPSGKKEGGKNELTE